MENIYAKLRDAALRDNQITNEEAALLDNILPNLDRYLEALDDALEDGLISEEEKEQLHKFRNQIWQSAVSTAMQDSFINPDEDALLITLAKILSQI